MSPPSVIHRKDVFCKRLRLKNFTVFKDAEFNFIGPGINVLVGENGTGKTHAMKAAFAWMLCQTFSGASDAGFYKTLLRTMQAQDEASLVSYSEKLSPASIEIDYGALKTRIPIGEKLPVEPVAAPGVERPVFIPSIEMLSHAKGFGDTYDTYELDFDWTVRDIVRLLGVRSRSPSPLYQKVIQHLEQNALKGSVEFDPQEDRYYLVQENNRSSMPMVAEGLRKIATLHALLVNGSIKSGTTLFWDEPEMNLNPVLMDELVHAIVLLARSGVQVILATHSYIILEELRDACKPEEVKYFGLTSSANGTTVAETDQLPLLNPNPILKQYESLYNRQIERMVRERPNE